MTDPIRPKNVKAEITETDLVVLRLDDESIPPIVFDQDGANRVGSLLSSQASIIKNGYNGEKNE